MTRRNADDLSRLVVAVDLGSNSFHILAARFDGGRLSVVDRLRERIALAAGLDDAGNLTPEMQEAALACLRRFGQRLRDVPAKNVRAVGTNTLRAAKNSAQFLPKFERALGHSIDIVPGREEARLSYLGVCHTEPDAAGRRLVCDIGGGSTEITLGERFDPLLAECLYMGCVSWTRRHFGNGRITRKRFREARIAARLEVQTIVRTFRAMGWEECLGASGTIRTIADALRAAGKTDAGRADGQGAGEAITSEGLEWLLGRILAAGHAEKIDIEGIDEERAGVIAGGLAILMAVFDQMGIDRMRVAQGGLREGVLWDLLGRIRHEDVRDRTIRGFAARHRVDNEQAARVERTALRLFAEAESAWDLNGDGEARNMLAWAAQLHEVGLSVTYSGHHKHGAYLLRNSDMPGFSRHEQDVLAAIVHEHRRSVGASGFEPLPGAWRDRAVRLTLLLRLAVRLHRSRTARALPRIGLRFTPDRIELTFPAKWLDRHPLTRADLEEEAAEIRGAGYTLRVR